MTLAPAPYRTRAIRFIRIAEIAGWQIKLYGISKNRPDIDSDFIPVVEKLAGSILPKPAVWPDEDTPSVSPFDRRYGAGFAIAHEGQDGLYVLVNWWVGEDMLKHHIHYSPTGALDAFEDLADTHVIACIWELAVICFERDAWLRTILANPDGPDMQAYIQARLSGDL